MKILVLNCGSSSLKYQLLDMSTEQVLAKGNYERIGQNNSLLTHKVGSEKYVFENPVKNHDLAIQFVLKQLMSDEYGVIQNVDEIDGVGHRIVHGGEKFTSSTIINDEVLEELKKCIQYAPLHNPAAISGIEACKHLMPKAKMVNVYDTAFHQTMPKRAYIYAVPYKYYEKYGVRKYGAHGTSHKFVAMRVAELMGKKVEDLKTVTCHLGQGASLAAVKNGVCVDTTMGLTPLGGIPMGSRSGDLDPSVVTFIMNKENLSADEVTSMLNKESGVYGLSGVSPDFRDIEDAAADGNERAKLSLDLYAYTVAQYIAKFIVAMNGIDTIVFTAGVGENGPLSRSAICRYLSCFGVKIDEDINDCKGKELKISSKDSKVEVYVVPTNEELMIARETLDLIK